MDRGDCCRTEPACLVPRAELTSASVGTRNEPSIITRAGQVETRLRELGQRLRRISRLLNPRPPEAACGSDAIARTANLTGMLAASEDLLNEAHRLVTNIEADLV